MCLGNMYPRAMKKSATMLHRMISTWVMMWEQEDPSECEGTHWSLEVD